MIAVPFLFFCAFLQENVTTVLKSVKPIDF